jgi:hypothetical protein
MKKFERIEEIDGLKTIIFDAEKAFKSGYQPRPDQEDLQRIFDIYAAQELRKRYHPNTKRETKTL